MAKRTNVVKEECRLQASASVRVEYPRNGELVARPRYTFQIGTNEKARTVEVSVDEGGWKACRESMGLWWHDWAGYAKGDHVLVARSRIGNEISTASAPRRFKVT